MTHLHALVMARQVLYLGVSDTPAWVVVKANACEMSASFLPLHDVDAFLQMPVIMV